MAAEDQKMEVTYRGVVYPAQTDAMGHLTVQYYVAAFDQAFWHLAAAMNYDLNWRFERSEGWADVNYVIDYRNELKVGEIFVVMSEVVKIGNSSMVTRHVMTNQRSEVCAEIKMTSVYFDLALRRAKALPDEVRAAVNARFVLSA